VVIERAPIPAGVHPNRELVLWMLSPQKHDRGPYSKSNPYTCPEWTLGSFYSGPTRISLIDTSTRKRINTIRLHAEFSGEDSFDVPYRILPNPYLVPGRTRGHEGKPALLQLRDFNGDGLPLQTAFFEAEACMGMLTTLVGYSPRQDKVIQYEVQLKITNAHIVRGGEIVDEAKPTTEISKWCDYLFTEPPLRPGYWKYEIDYSGRGGTLDSYNVHYDSVHERFIGTLRKLAIPDDW
jgi:hypothetical protein